MKAYKILTSQKSSRAIMITCWLVYMVAYLTRNTYAASIVHLTGQGLLTTSLAGLISTCYFISYGTGHMINGFLADRMKPVTMLGIGIVGTAVCNVLMPVVTPVVPAMAAVWLANGYFESMLWAPIVVLLSGRIEKGMRYRAMSTIAYSRPTGQILAYLFTAACSYFGIGIKAPYVIAAVCALATCVLLVLVSSRAFSAPDTVLVEPIQNKTSEAKKSDSVLRLLLSSGAVIFLLPVLFHGMLKDGVATWVPTLLRDSFGADETLSTLLAIVLPITGLLGVSFANFLLGRKRLKGNHAVIGIIIMLLTAVPVSLLLNTRALPLVVAVACLCAVSLLMESFNQVFSTLMPTCFASKGRAATVSGIINSLIYGGSAISIYAFGAIAEFVGWNVATVIWLALALVSAVILAFSIKPWREFLNKQEN